MKGSTTDIYVHFVLIRATWATQVLLSVSDPLSPSLHSPCHAPSTDRSKK